MLLLGSGGLAERVARLQQRPGRTVLLVGTERTAGTAAIGFEDLPAALQALDGLPARAVGLLSTDLLANLQVALSLQQRWPDARIAMLAHAFGAAEQLGDLLGGVAVISAMDLVADAMVATRLGERIEAVLRLRGTNLLQVLYRVAAGDTLCGRSVARLENGYGITVVSLFRPRRGAPWPCPGSTSWWPLTTSWWCWPRRTACAGSNWARPTRPAVACAFGTCISRRPAVA